MKKVDKLDMKIDKMEKKVDKIDRAQEENTKADENHRDAALEDAHKTTWKTWLYFSIGLSTVGGVVGAVSGQIPIPGVGG